MTPKLNNIKYYDYRPMFIFFHEFFYCALPAESLMMDEDTAEKEI